MTPRQPATEEPQDGPPSSLRATPSALSPADQPEADAAPDDQPSPGTPQQGDTGDAPRTGPQTTRTLAAFADPTGDAGLRAPGYADLVGVSVHDDGPAARFVVDMTADIPQRLAEGEVVGLGVDLYGGPGDRESSHQLFADGGSDGWTAYLQTPDGFVDFPGAFRLGGRRLVFEVPWTSLGDLRSGEVRVFTDWTRTGRLLNEAGSDVAPDEGRTPFTR